MGTVKKLGEFDSRKRSAVEKLPDHRTGSTRHRAPRLRCPFSARSPGKFGVHPSCHSLGFESNARVVEHLKRVHGPTRLSDDAADTKPDTVTDIQPNSRDHKIERVSEEQLILIRNIPRSSDVQAKWEKIYRIVFPGDEPIKSVYMPSVDTLRDYARNPPDWVIENMTRRIGLSSREIHSLLTNFLVYLDVVSSGDSSSIPPLISPPPTILGQSCFDADSLADITFMDEMKDMKDHSMGDIKIMKNPFMAEIKDMKDPFMAEIKDMKDPFMADTKRIQNRKDLKDNPKVDFGNSDTNTIMAVDDLGGLHSGDNSLTNLEKVTQRVTNSESPTYEEFCDDRNSTKMSNTSNIHTLSNYLNTPLRVQPDRSSAPNGKAGHKFSGQAPTEQAMQTTGDLGPVDEKAKKHQFGNQKAADTSKQLMGNMAGDIAYTFINNITKPPNDKSS